MDLEALSKTWLTALNNHDANALSEVFAEDAVVVGSGEPEPTKGLEAIVGREKAFFAAFPDLRQEAHRVVVSGNLLVMHGTARGTNTGALPTPDGELRPSGNSLECNWMLIASVNEQGKIAEEHIVYDTAAVAQSLGQ